MTTRAHGQVRRSQVITTYGPGALIDLPGDSAIVSGLEGWPHPKHLEEIREPRLVAKLRAITGIPTPRFYAPPPESTDPRQKMRGITVYRFPEWFVVQEEEARARRGRSRRLVHRKALDPTGKFEKRKVVAIRFVRACPRGHVDDLPWRFFVHEAGVSCRKQLWLDERGTTGDLAELSVRCECGRSRRLSEAMDLERKPLGTCRGTRPWLGRHAAEECDQPSRLLVRTASNAWFPQVVSALSLPEPTDALRRAVEHCWDQLHVVTTPQELDFALKYPQVAAALHGFDPKRILQVVEERRSGTPDRPMKEAELEAILGVPEGFDEDVPPQPDFHARRLPAACWRGPGPTESLAAVVQLHRLREVLALAGFTRLEPLMPDIHGEYDSEVTPAALSLDPAWFPAVENRGEGVFLQLVPGAVDAWLKRPGVVARVDALRRGHQRWCEDRKIERPFPGGPFVLLHTLSHLLIQVMSMECGYPASSIRERVYVDSERSRYGLLLYTGSPDAEGTLGGLVQQARHIGSHLRQALRMSALCSSDPICAHHEPGESIEGRWLHGASCHGCSLVAETSCEMRNDYLDRALVVPVIGTPDAAFFPVPG